MTGCTRNRSMGAGQRKFRERGMVKPCIPGSCRRCMALFAVRRESRHTVVGIGRAGIIRSVASDTRGRGSDKLIVRNTVVAVLTGERGVFSNQREPR